MKFTLVAALAAISGAAAYSNVTYTTEVVTAYTTYCPGPTEIVHGDKTYTVTSATTLTISDCPCTISKPVITSSVVVCHTCGYNATMTTKPVAPTSSKPAIATAGAGKQVALSGGALAGVLGFAALVL